MGETAGSVTHLLWSGHVGGIERLVTDLASAQRAAGTDAAVAFGRREGPFAEEAVARGIPVTGLGLRSGYDVRPRHIRAVAARMREREVLHLHGFNLPFAAIARSAGRPVVYTEHGFSRRSRLDLVAQAKIALHRRFLRQGVDRVVANSGFTADRLATARGLARDRIEVVHNGIDVERLPDPTRARPEDGVTAACIGRLVPWKRFDRAIMAVDGVRGLQLLVVGDGPERPALERLVRERSLEDRVRLLGARSDVPEVLRTADVLIQPSFDEWFGLAALEGSAMGLLPMVFDDAGGALEALPPDGVVVADVEELRRELEAASASGLLADGPRRARADWARERFSIRRAADHYGAVYRACTTPSRRG